MARENVRRRCGTARIARIIREALREGHVVDIEGFGTFRPAKNGGFDFTEETVRASSSPTSKRISHR